MKFVLHISMMIRVLAVLIVASGGVVAQPLSCIDDLQCLNGYYCFQKQECRKCLDCEWLKREPLPVPSNCTRSVVQCGQCLPGFVSDPSGNLNAQCVLSGTAGTSPTSGKEEEGPQSYMWLIIGIGVLLLLITIATVVFVVRNTNTFKILATTRTSLGSPFSQQYRSPESEGGAPPPYNLAAPQYTPVRPTSPPPPLEPAPLYRPDQPPHHPPEMTRSLVESKETGRGTVTPRERDANQEALVYNHPRVRFPDQPPSYDSALSDEESYPDIHDDETVGSIWTPADDANNNDNQNSSSGAGAVSEPGSAAELSTLLSEARGTTVVRAPPAPLPRAPRPPPDHGDEPSPSKVLCLRQDSNPLHNNTRMLPEAGEGSSQQSQPKALDIKIYVQQHNDVKVFSS